MIEGKVGGIVTRVNSEFKSAMQELLEIFYDVFHGKIMYFFKIHILQIKIKINSRKRQTLFVCFIVNLVLDVNITWFFSLYFFKIVVVFFLFFKTN